MMNTLLDCTLAFLALINPVSKIFVISTLSAKTADREIRFVAMKACLVAIGILLLFALLGNPLLKYVFRVDIYSFKIAGGLVLLLRGFNALNKGLFFEIEAHQRLEDLSIVPLASPMIAGPAAITASVSFPAIYGLPTTMFSMMCAVFVTLIVMVLSKTIGNVLTKFNIMGALIRITGLIVATIGIQMVLNGMVEFINTL